MKKLALMVSSLVAVAAVTGCGTRVASTVSNDGLLSAMSKAPGVKRALLIGINKYQLPGANLNGCINDVEDAKAKLLAPLGFQAANVTTITDAKATRANMLAGLKALVASGKAGDFLYFHYSGHGAQVPDTNGDEPEGQDEILCPTDMAVVNGAFKNAIVDDELQSILGTIKPGVNLLFVSDSCNSGTVDQIRNQAITSKVRGLTLPANLRNLTPLQVDAAAQATFKARAAAGKYVLISGCQDDQTSADAYINGRYNGALTYMLLDAWKQAPKTYGDWHKATLAGLEAGNYEQRPNLVGNANAKPFVVE